MLSKHSFALLVKMFAKNSILSDTSFTDILSFFLISSHVDDSNTQCPVMTVNATMHFTPFYQGFFSFTYTFGVSTVTKKSPNGTTKQNE